MIDKSDPSPICIEASQKHADLGVDVTEGEIWEFEVVSYSGWKDWFETATPEGIEGNFLMRMLASKKRYPKAGYLALIGSVGLEDRYLFFIGKKCKHRFECSGRLYAFANDIHGFYWNNHGRVNLRIVRQK